MSSKKIVIIGGGAAGWYAAKRIRKNDPSAEVFLFEGTENALYAKVRLPEYVAGVLPREKLFLPGAPDEGLKVFSGTPVLEIDRTKQQIVTADARYDYDILLLATGASANVPPVPGLKNSACVLRTITDADALCCCKAENVIVLGGGLLGLEAAWALKERGMAVTVVEMADRLLPRQLNETESARLLTAFTALGMKVILGASVTGCRDCKELELADGTTIAADLLLVSAGIAPEKTLAEKAGLLCGRGVTVDRQMRTSDPCIYAAGDCAEIDGRTVGLWIAAKDQGEAAADIICGKRETFEPPVYMPKLKVSGIDFNQIRGA